MRDGRVRSHLENLAIIGRTNHGDIAGENVLQVFANDSDDISGTPTATFRVTEQGRFGATGIRIFDDFCDAAAVIASGNTTKSNWVIDTTGGAATGTATVTAVPGGTLVMLTAASSDHTSGNQITVVGQNGNTSYVPSNGVSFETRLKLTAANDLNGQLEFGFNTAGGGATLGNDYAVIRQAGGTSAAAANGLLSGAAKNNGGTEATVVFSPSYTLVNGTYVVLRVDIDTAGVARFYANGNLLGTIGTVAVPAVTKTQALVPFCKMGGNHAEAHSVTVDYFDVVAGRP